MTGAGGLAFLACGAILGWHTRPLITGSTEAFRSGPRTGSTEAAMAGAFGASALWAPGWPVLAAACWLACCAVPLAFIDARSHRLPNPLTMAAFGGTVLFLLLAASATGSWSHLGRAVAGGIVLAGCYAALAATGAVGLGDAKIAASVGALLAWAGWVPLIAGAFAAWLLAFPFAVVMLIRRRAGAGRRRMAFGPFIVAGTFLTLAILGI